MGERLRGTDETVIGEAYDRPVVVHRFPAAIKAFYMEPDPERAELTLSADILAPEGYGEIVGGRRAHVERGKAAAAHPGAQAARGGVPLVPRPPQVRLGAPRRFGMGIERLVTWICGLEHLRETIAFPRMLYRIYP